MSSILLEDIFVHFFAEYVSEVFVTEPSSDSELFTHTHTYTHTQELLVLKGLHPLLFSPNNTSANMPLAQCV